MECMTAEQLWLVVDEAMVDARDYYRERDPVALTDALHRAYTTAQEALAKMSEA